MLSVTVLQHLLFIHAFDGCDTISAIHDKGEGAILRLIQKSKEAQQLSAVFNKPLASQAEIVSTGINLFILLYGGKNEDSLQSLRYTNYMKMAASYQGYHRENDLHGSTIFECIFRFVFLTIISSVSLNYMFLNNKK